MSAAAESAVDVKPRRISYEGFRGFFSQYGQMNEGHGVLRKGGGSKNKIGRASARGRGVFFGFLPTRAVPEFEVFAESQKNDVAIESCQFAQRRRNEQSPRLVEGHAFGAAEHETLQSPRGKRQAREFVAFARPDGFGIEKKTPVGVTGKDEPRLFVFGQGLAMPRWHAEPSLDVKFQKRSPLKHFRWSP